MMCQLGAHPEPMKRTLSLIALAAFACAGLRADFSYEQTSQLTGGVMKSLGFLSKQLREPTRSTVLLKGDRMAHISATSASVVDLAAETITEINFQKKTYSVMTFAEMEAMLKSLDAKSKEKDQPEWTTKVSVKETGQTQTINGMNAREAVLTIEFEGTDQKTNQPATMMTMTCDMWLTPNVAGYDEVRSFYERMARKLNWTPGSMSMASGRQAKGIAAMYKEAAKLNGVPVRQLVKMNMGAGMAQGEDGQAMAGAQAQSQQQQQQPQPEQQVEAERPTIGGALGRLGGRFGGFGRKKKQPQQEEQPKVEPQQTSTEQAPQGGAGGPGSLMEIQSDLSAFSSATVDASKFEVPAGFKKVDRKR
jgi:hypothetical protein